MKPNLTRELAPTATSIPPRVVLQRAAAYGLAFSITIAPAQPTLTDLYKRVTLQPIAICGPQSTCSALQLKSALTAEPADNWLEAAINEIHAQIPEDVWARLPANGVANIDIQVYRT